ncbi:MAG: nickel-dependent lactate racemase [Gammaproteobacteria bacterium]|nr:nickel-dependent lactate racemase [Gammaproteobacteria bacterium]
MKVSLLYGKRTIDVAFSAHAQVSIIRKPQMPLLQDSQAAVDQAVASASMFAHGCKSACILVCDVTRPVPNGLFLRSLIKQLIDGGIDRRSITCLIATGLHRPNEAAELTSVINDDWVLEHIRIENHHARVDAEHAELGTTQSGTVVKLDRRFMDADLKIVTGLVEPHFMAGWSGGRKVVAPGVAHADTIRVLHSARFIEHPLTRECVLAGNPLHEELLEIVEMLRTRSRRDIYALNTVIDEHRRLGFVNFGEIVASHNEAVAFAERFCVVPIREKFDVVLTSAAGYPLDLTYYQAVKGMVTPLDILADEGTLIVASECAEGLGSDNFRASQAKLLAEGPDGFIRRIEQKRFADIDEWETEMQLRATRQTRVQMYSEGLQGEDRRLTGIEMIDSIQAQIDASAPERRIAVIPEGPYVVPRFATS